MLARKQFFLYAGVGLALSGIATIFVIYQTLPGSDTSGEQSSGTQFQNNQFELEEVHANPNLVIHMHAQIGLIKDGQRQKVPAEIGIAREMWHDHSLDKYGPSEGLLAPLHTHDETGTIHIESVVQRNYTLGEFFTIWGIEPESILKVTTVDGNPIEEYWSRVFVGNDRFVVEMAGD